MSDQPIPRYRAMADKDSAGYYVPYIPLSSLVFKTTTYNVDFEPIKQVENKDFVFSLAHDIAGNLLPKAQEAFDWILANTIQEDRMFYYDGPHSTIAQSYSHEFATIHVKFLRQEDAALFKMFWL
jgi:hypothetical protein